jgi:manganese/zinc/iron transport system permease protein
MVALGGDGRNLLGLLLGSAISAAVGLLSIQWIVARTRLTEDAAIGAVLGVFFGFGHRAADGDPVDVIGAAGGAGGVPAGIDGRDAAAGRDRSSWRAALLALGLIWAMRRPMTLVSFDADLRRRQGYNVSRIDLMMMACVLVVTVIGLKVVGLVLIVALLIIPPVAARFWTDQVGPHDLDFAAPSAAVRDMSARRFRPPRRTCRPVRSSSSWRRPSSCCVAALAPVRGLAAAVLRQRHFKARVHQRQGLLALARQEPIREAYTLRLLQRERALSAPMACRRTPGARPRPRSRAMNAAGTSRGRSIRMRA